MIEKNISWPSVASTIQSKAEALTTQVEAESAAAIERLNELSNDAGYSRGILSSQAESLLGLRNDLENLLNKGQVLTVSPYQFQVGTSLSSGKYLNPQLAVDSLMAKLRDQVDKNRPTQEQHCILIMVSESNIETFSSILNSLIELFPLPEWCQIARQATALSTNAVDKLHQPAEVVLPRFKPAANLNANPLRDFINLQGSQLATVESLANDKNTVINKLQSLAAKRNEKLSSVTNSIEELKAVAGSIWSTELSGSLESLTQQLSQLTLPGNKQYTVASVLLSPTEQTFFKELLCSA